MLSGNIFPSEGIKLSIYIALKPQAGTMKIWTPNQSLQNGRFIIQKVLGSGGFGITYSILEQRTGKLFVLKTLNHLQQGRKDFEERQVKFVQEMTRLARCTHPHIVKFEDVIQEDGLWGMLMEYIDGVDLKTYVDQDGQLSEDEALLYINQIGQALECVHQQGFLHRDIKPHNILLRRGKQEAVLIDFGLARQFSTGEKSISMTSDGTEGYAPIEQYRRKGNFGAYTDVYGLAATRFIQTQFTVFVNASHYFLCFHFSSQSLSAYLLIIFCTNPNN